MLDVAVCSGQSFSPIPLEGFDRRTALKLGVGAAAAYSVGSPPSRAEAGVLGFIGRAAFSALIGWFVERALDAFVSSDADRLGLKYHKNPRPTWSAFNNQFAAPWYATNRTWYHSMKRTKSGQRLGFGPYILDYDLNGEELLQIRREYRYYGGVLVPSTYREPLHCRDISDLRLTLSYYDLSFEDVKCHYKREYRSEDGGKHLGVGVTLKRNIAGIPAGSKRHLLA